LRSGAVFEAPTFVAGFDDVAMMGETIEQRGRHLCVAEDARPFAEVQIGADFDEAGHAFQREAGHLFRFEAGRDSDLMSATVGVLPRIGTMMFCAGDLVKRVWIFAGLDFCVTGSRRVARFLEIGLGGCG
jgi:hypothetical protein